MSKQKVIEALKSILGNDLYFHLIQYLPFSVMLTVAVKKVFQEKLPETEATGILREALNLLDKGEYLSE